MIYEPMVRSNVNEAKITTYLDYDSRITEASDRVEERYPEIIGIFRSV
jgi:hypothetical protein